MKDSQASIPMSSFLLHSKLTRVFQNQTKSKRRQAKTVNLGKIAHGDEISSANDNNFSDNNLRGEILPLCRLFQKDGP